MTEHVKTRLLPSMAVRSGLLPAIFSDILGILPVLAVVDTGNEGTLGESFKSCS